MSSEFWREALTLFAGGVNSPVRASVRPYPFFTSKGEGAYLFTEDGKKVIDYVLGYGPLILGHSPPRVRDKVKEQLDRGWLYGTPSRLEIELAKKITTHLPSIQKVRFVNSGTEATMNAIRLARGFTGRSKILKFNGNYHGAHDYGLIEAGSAVSDFGISVSKGIPKEVVQTVVLCEYNDLECVEKRLKDEEIAGVILEPVMGNYGVILPDKDFLGGVREFTKTYGSVLIFDEVITGFRLGIGGAQSIFKITPDLTTLGKIIGGGLPIGAIGGRANIMDNFTPAGNVFNAGTFNANPLSMSAGIATIEELESGNIYEVMDRRTEILAEEIDASIEMEHTTNRIGSMFQFFLGVKEVKNASDAKKVKRALYMKIHEELLKEGVFIPPSPLETIFISKAHDDEIIKYTADKFKKIVRDVK